MADVLTFPTKEGQDAVIKRLDKIYDSINILIPNERRIYGASWDREKSPVLTRTDSAVDLIANIGVGNELVRNDFDLLPIWGEMHKVFDDNGNEFIRIPKFYIRKVKLAGIRSWQVTKTEQPGFYLPWCFWDFANKKELPHIDVGCYDAGLSASKLTSQPDTFPLINTTIVSFRTYAKNNNVGGLAGYQQLDVHTVDLLRTLFFIEFATLHSQGVMTGFTGGAYSDDDLVTADTTGDNKVVLANARAERFVIGQTISCGTGRTNSSRFNNRVITDITEYDANNKNIHFDGDPATTVVGNVVASRGWKSGFSKDIKASSGVIVANDAKHPMSYRGIENFYGSIFQWVDGVNITDHQAWVTEDAEDYASNAFASPYKKLGYANGLSSGNIKEMGFDPSHPYAEFPVTIGGTETEYFCDRYSQDAGERVALFGGRWYAAGYSGVSCWRLYYSAATTDISYGGRLLKKAL